MKEKLPKVDKSKLFEVVPEMSKKHNIIVFIIFIIAAVLTFTAGFFS